MMDIRVPESPVFVGCHAAADTHDTQCVSYQGPDTNYTGREICVSSNGDHIAIVDVTDKTAPLMLATLTYPQLGFTHQGWLTEDQRFFLLGDELDERNFGLATRTLVFDLGNLEAPTFLYAYSASTRTIDHNLYVRGNRVFEANYTSGLRLLQFADLSARDLHEIAYFDTFPAGDAVVFDGAWSVYPYLPSGNIIVNDISNGLFVLGLDVLTVLAGPDQSTFAGQSLLLEGTSSRPVTHVIWRQTRGTPATIADPAALVTSVTLPSLVIPETLTFELTVTDRAGATATDTIHIRADVIGPGRTTP